MEPPVNPKCHICFNLDATRLRDEEGLTIEIHGNEEFRQSAANLCLACKMIYDGVTRFTRSTEDFPSVTLELIEGNGNLLEGPTGQSLLAMVKRVKWGPQARHKSPLWDSRSGALFLEFYTPPDTPSIWSAIPCRPEPALDRASDSAVKRVKSWLEMCDKLHPICCLPDMPVLPTRVIFVGEEHSFRLVIPNREEHANYAALSWRWGPPGKHPPKTLWENLQERTEGRWKSPLPPLFTDAIEFTRKLGLNYLWIDALCIIQDSAEDWSSESTKMTEIYNNAYLTIAADSCASAAERLTGQGEEYIIDPKGHRIAEGRDEGITIDYLASDGSLRNLLRAKVTMTAPGLNNPTTVGVRYNDGKTSHGYHGVTFVPKSHLDDRGWCFQENVLSRRLLHFGQTELSFQCLKMEACECTSISNPYLERTDRHLIRLKRKILLEETDMGEAWLDAVESFTYRDLGLQTDKLNAIAGIAQKIADRFPANEAKYLCGIWRSEIETQLAWLVIPPVKILRPVPARGSKRQAIAPSWSWASATGAVKFQRWARFRVLSTQLAPDDIGQASAYVTVRGRLCKTVNLYHTRMVTARWEPYMPNLQNIYADIQGLGTEPVEDGHVIFDKWSLKDRIKWDLEGYSALENVNGLGFAMLLRRIANPRFGPEGIELYQRVGVIYPESALKYYHMDPAKEVMKSQYESYGIEEQTINII